MVASSLSSDRVASVNVASGAMPSALATSPNCRSRSTITASPGASRASPSARFVAIVVFPAPPFGHIDRMTRVASTVSSSASNALRRVWRRRGRARTLRGARCSSRRERSRRGRRRAARPAGDRSTAPATITVLMSGRSWSIARANSSVRSVAMPGPMATTSAPRCPSSSIIRDACSSEQSLPPVPQLTVETALERGPHSLLEVRVGCRQHELVHGLSRLRPVVPTSPSRGPGMRVSTALRSGLSRMRRERCAGRVARWLSGRSRCRRRGSRAGGRGRRTRRSRSAPRWGRTPGSWDHAAP